MAKKKIRAKSSQKKVHSENTLADAIGLGNFQTMTGAQIAQVGTMFENNRNYLVTNLRQLLNTIYVEYSIVETVVDVPVDDAFSGGIIIKTKQLDPEQIKLLSTYMDRQNDMREAAQACKWQRLFGGGAVIVINDENPDMPLTIENIQQNSNVAFKAADLWELYKDHYTTDEEQAAKILPAPLGGKGQFYNYYGKKVHPSRVLALVGKRPPSLIKSRLRGWGLSAVETMVSAINQYLKSNDVAFEVMDEFKLDIFKMVGLNSSVGTIQGEGKIRRRVQLANQQKNYQNALVLDKEDDYENKQLNFSGLAEIMSEIRMQVAASVRMPLSKLFGIQAQGFNDGESDVKNYNAMIESSIRSKIKYDIEKMVQIRCMQLFGLIPSDLEIDFEKLSILTAEQEQTVKDSEYARLCYAFEKGLIDAQTFQEACNQKDLLPIKIQADGNVVEVFGQDEEGDTKIEGGKKKKDSKAAPEAKDPK